VGVDMRGIKKQAIDEFTEIIRVITLLEARHSGSTGFLGHLKDITKEELLDFVHPKGKGLSLK